MELIENGFFISVSAFYIIQVDVTPYIDELISSVDYGKSKYKSVGNK